MEQMRQEMVRLFNQSSQWFQGGPRYGNLATTVTASPNFDMSEEKDRYVIKADMPGSDQSDVNVKFENQTLTVSGKRDQTLPRQKNGHILRQERVSGAFQRTMTLPGPVDEAGMKTKYENGVLTITIPKANTANPNPTISPQ
jgi:HSP20 family protein